MSVDAASVTGPMRVMTFNIQHGRGMDRRVDLARTARVIRDARPDVVGLQEVDCHYGARSGYLDQAGWLAGELGMQVAYGPNTDLDPDRPDGERRRFGNAILSVYPIVDRENIPLPRSGGHEQRGLLRVRVDVRGTPWVVHATHLQHDDPAERLVQARAVNGLLGTRRRLIVMGDLNAQPTTAEIRALADGLVDTWQAAGSGPGYTSSCPVPSQRIDYILHSPDVGTVGAAVVGSARARIASDHLPVVADIGP